MKYGYMVITVDSWQVIARGFKTFEGACGWMNAHDYGQYENDGGLIVVPYEIEEES